MFEHHEACTYGLSGTAFEGDPWQAWSMFTDNENPIFDITKSFTKRHIHEGFSSMLNAVADDAFPRFQPLGFPRFMLSLFVQTPKVFPEVYPTKTPISFVRWCGCSLCPRHLAPDMAQRRSWLLSLRPPA